MATRPRKPQADLTPEQVHYIKHRRRLRWFANHTVLFIIVLAIVWFVQRGIDKDVVDIPMMPFLGWGVVVGIHGLYAIGFFGRH